MHLDSLGKVLTMSGIINMGEFYFSGSDNQSFFDYWTGATPGWLPVYNITGQYILPEWNAARNDGQAHLLNELANGTKFYVENSGFREIRITAKAPNNTTYEVLRYSGVIYDNYTVGNMYFGLCKRSDYVWGYGVYLSWTLSDGRKFFGFSSVADNSTLFTMWQNILDGQPLDLSDPYATLPDNENPGQGYGPYDYTSEVDLPPALPSASAAQCGFVSLWNPTITELQGLASYLWTSGLFDINTWRHLFSNPMDCILSVGIIPFVPDREENKEEIIFCGTSHSGISSYRVPTQMYVIPMGTMHITGMSQGYTDYEPYAKASIFLPYCGTYALSCDEIVDADMSLEYHVDIYTGACVAYLTIERDNSNGEHVNAVMYQFTGNMLATVPVTGADHSNFIQSLLFMGAAIGATVATAGASAPEIGGAMAAGDAVSLGTANMVTAGSAINTVMSMKPNVMRSGNLSSTAGLLGKQAPTITITWSNICRPDDEYKLAGMPIHKSGTLSDFKGFTVVSAVHMDNITCTDEERTMIEEQLYKGVII